MSATVREPERRLRGALWRLVGRPAYRWSFHNWYRLRAAVLRLFGARMGRDTKFRRTVEIDRPWNLDVGDRVMIGDGAVLDARAPIVLGRHAVVSQLAVVTTRVADVTREGAPERVAPIRIGAECWVAADAVVLPGGVLHDGAVLGARSVLDGEVPAWTVAAGHPARALRPRPWRGAVGGAS